MFRPFGNLMWKLWRLPAIARMAFELVEAHEEAARQDYRGADRRLSRIEGLGLPEHMMKRSTLTLLKALVALRLGDAKTAVELLPRGVHEVSFLRKGINASERDYLKYAGRLLLEEATEQLGEPLTMGVGVEYEDLDISRVGDSFWKGFPIYRSRYADPPEVH
ncbi:MAG: hypothetical protein V4707_10125 [Pseudomonadota bacterium]